MGRLSLLDHTHNPITAAAIVEQRSQQDAAIVVNKMTPGGIETLPRTVEQPGPVVGAEIANLPEMRGDIRHTTVVLGVGEDLDDPAQHRKLTVVQAAL